MNFEDIYVRKYEETSFEKSNEEDEKEAKYLTEFTPTKIKLHYVLFQLYTSTLGLYGLYLCFTETKWQTIVFTMMLDILCMLAVTAGAHRLWSHRTYKAKLPLRIFLAFFFTMSFQESIFTWVLNHRIHHKYSDTNADPHNARRGLWYSHMGWLMTLRTDDFRKKTKNIDMSDIKADPVAHFQWKYYYPLLMLICYFLPCVIPIWFWNESLHSAFCVAVCLRLIMGFHQTFIVNSLAHKFGYRPYGANIFPTDSSYVSIFVLGEGFHNYHHTFPWDYRTSEFGLKVNLTTPFIDLMAWLRLATDRKIAAKCLIEIRKRKTEEE